MQKNPLRIILVLIVLLLISTTFIVLTSSKQSNLETTTVSLKWKHQAQFAGIYTAKERKLYRKNGLDVQLKEFDFKLNLVDELIEERSDFSIMSAEVFLTAVQEGAPIQAVAAIYQISPYTLVSLSDMNIHTPADLDGKVLGNKGGKLESEVFYKQLLQKIGINLTKADLRNLEFGSTEFEDIVTRKVDVIGLYRTDQLYLFDKAEVQYNLIHPEQFGVNIYNDVIVTTNKLIENNPELVRDFIQTTIKGWKYALENKEKAITYTMPYITDDLYKDLDYQRYILENSHELIKPDSNTTIGKMSNAQWEKLYTNMVNTHEAEQNNKIDTREVFTNQFLSRQ